MKPIHLAAVSLPLLCLPVPLVRAAQTTLTVTDDTSLVQDAGADDNNFGGRNELLTSNSSAGASNRRFGLLRFDVSSLAGQFASIDSMTLKLRLRNGGSRAVPTTGQILDIFRIAEANAGWVEGTGQNTGANDGVTAVDSVSYRVKKDNADTAQRISWAGSAGLNTVDTDYFSTAMGSTLAFNGASGYAPGVVIEIPLTATGFTLTEMVNDWIADGAINAGLLIRGRTGAGANGQIFFDSNEGTDPGFQPAQLVINYTPAAPDAYTQWAQSKELTGADIDPTSNPDEDGEINLMEFALDGNPKSGINDGKVAHQIAVVGGESAFVLTLPVRNGAVFDGLAALFADVDGIRYEIRASTDLATWTLDVDEVTPALSGGLTALSTGWSYRSFRIAGPVSSRSRASFQIAVSQNQ